ncbi:Molybdenum cofactor synthesis domain-containing protein [Zalerion maritima]|uniref:Molybdenum cofactor synthesis domain-containing protein n=1 Tax=Zalerion maritima TaxID=339359 RepID=A0AAD5RGS4_9PEZI|nr:Molybdenum cofactor synthesis domain-containing protein [Zalerion maritima]
MTSSASVSADERNRRTIHTAACLIIGDEVLGGKVSAPDPPGEGASFPTITSKTIRTVDRMTQASLSWQAWSHSIQPHSPCPDIVWWDAVILSIVQPIWEREKQSRGSKEGSEAPTEAVARGSANYLFPGHREEEQSLKRIEVIEDDESEIMEASIAKAFSLPLVLHEDAYARMRKLSKPHPGQPSFSWDEDTPQRTARLRMVRLPFDETRSAEDQVVFPSEDLWVPVAVVNGNIHILPGVPKLFQNLLTNLEPILKSRLAVDPSGNGGGTTRILISTPMPESAVAEYLTELAARVQPKGIKVGSYPRWEKKTNTVTLTGKDPEFLESLVPEVCEKVKGKRIQKEGEDDDDDDKTQQVEEVQKES